ncbi:hypothetical protein D9758_014184 [Tetrapyrgos nigripes]|uniref:beta-N-acetylhexosaminidase n=1 Tax=Tetrapyrgos nigripes TaxID=182062 RepID=A0A8H5FN62_9AGAR|nr:hypothetical protein D9758_014184 [Tetrapyrgos nigripes]
MQTYTPKDVNIVDYAAARGIDVLPEIDTPGHTVIISKAYPEHIGCAEAKLWASIANEPPQANALSPLYLPPKYFPSEDELNTNGHDQDPQTQDDFRKSGRTLEEALDMFTQATRFALDDLRTPSNTIVMVWISSLPTPPPQVGYRFVHSLSDHFYLDCGAGEWIGADPWWIHRRIVGVIRLRRGKSPIRLI